MLVKEEQQFLTPNQASLFLYDIEHSFAYNKGDAMKEDT